MTTNGVLSNIVYFYRKQSRSWSAVTRNMASNQRDDADERERDDGAAWNRRQKVKK